MSTHLMLVPSLACPASCSYCFGPHAGSADMTQETVEAVVEWEKANNEGDTLEITFHGGEPLVPGMDYYRMALPLLKDGLSPRRVRFGMQSNLWLLTEELCELFSAYHVSIGTSLDGPEPINDSQRGPGNFQKTMAGIQRARAHGIQAGVICTFTHVSLPHAQEIFDFFLGEGLNFSVHAATPSIRHPGATRWALTAEEHGRLLTDMLDRYLPNLERIRIPTLDAMCRSVSRGQGGICTFGDCPGGYLAVGPSGEIFPCQRFAGLSEFSMGNVHDHPSRSELMTSPTWRAFQSRQEAVRDECGDCAHFKYCRGGCSYNVLAAHGGRFDGRLRDPHCPAYQHTFSYITGRALEEVFSTENLEQVVAGTQPEMGLLQKGRLLSLMRDRPHPHENAQYARRILASVILAVIPSPLEAARTFEKLSPSTNPARAEASMLSLHQSLNEPSQHLNNLYLHVTFACNLHCLHCYAGAGPDHKGALPTVDILRAIREAAGLGFRHAVITGGEPLMHPARDELLEALACLRMEIKPLLTVLRTNLALPLQNDLLRRIANGTDQVVVSLDGDRETHAARRGPGTYDLTVANLRALVAMHGTAEISLASVLPLEQVHGAPGESLRALAKELGIHRTRFRPLLPLGRAIDSQLEILPETQWGQFNAQELVAFGFTPSATCGFGQNLYVEPDGAAYPCYAWHGAHWRLGSLQDNGGLPALVNSAAFQGLKSHTVNTNRACRDCPLRYLCGGSCRAWNRAPARSQTDLDAPPRDCTALHARARSLLLSALGHLGIREEQWLDCGLPIPASPPGKFDFPEPLPTQ